MTWLYAQTWLWLLLAFLVGVALAWFVLVVPARRRLGAPGADRPVADPGPAPATGTPDADRPPAVDETVTEQLPAVDPALSTLDTFDAFGVPAGGTRGAATAGLGAAGLGAAGLGAGPAPGADRPAPDDPATRES